MSEQDDIARRNQLVHDLDLRDTINRLESRLAWAEGMAERFADYMDAVPCQCNGSQAWNQLPAGHVCERCELLADYASGPSDGKKGEV